MELAVFLVGTAVFAVFFRLRHGNTAGQAVVIGLVLSGICTALPHVN